MLRSISQVHTLQTPPEFSEVELQQLLEEIARPEAAVVLKPTSRVETLQEMLLSQLTQRQWRQQMDEELARLRAGIATGRLEHSPAFPKLVDSKRHYPGEPAGAYLAWYLAYMPISVTDRLLKLMRPLLRFEKLTGSGRVDKIKRAERPFRRAFETLEAEAMRDAGKVEDITSDGLVVRPRTLRGIAAFAILALLKERRLDRIRRCTSCRNWCYMRFKHQEFCNDTKKKCQWNHYHTPEWRKQHREQNRRHQQAFRGRIFGKGSS